MQILEDEMVDQGTPLNRLMMDMRAMQTDAMALRQPVGALTEADQADVPSFSDMFSQAVNKVHATQQTAADLATAFEMGQGDVDLTEVMIAAQKSSVSFQALTQVRNKLVQAYQDIMQMPV